MSISNPTIVFSPGAWIYPDMFDNVRTNLAGQGYQSTAVSHPSVGMEPPIGTFHNDVATLRSVIEGLVNEEKNTGEAEEKRY